MFTQQDYDQALEKTRILEKAINEHLEKANILAAITKSLETQIYRIKKDKEGKYILIFNEGRIADKYEMTTDLIQGKEYKEVFGESLFNEFKPYFEKAFSGKTLRYRGFVFRERYFSTILTPFKRDQDGNVIEISGNTQDINELFETEKKYKEKIEVTDNIIEHNPYSIQICDADGRHIRSNNAFYELFKGQPKEDWSLFNDKLLTKAGVIDKISRVKQGEIVDIPELWYNAHDIDPANPDNLICLRAIHFPIHNIKNELENIIVMHEDVTSKMALKLRVRELEEFHDLTVGRELQMQHLEKQLEELRAKVKNK